MTNIIFANIYKDSLIKNSIYLVTTNFINIILAFFFWLIAAKYYMPKEIGSASAILSSMTLIATLSSIGLPTAIIFYLPKYPKKTNRIINSCLITSIISSIIFSLIFIAGINIWIPGLNSILKNVRYSVIFITATLMTTVSAFLTGAFTAGRRTSFNMIKENFFGFTKIFPLILFTGLGAMGIFISWIVGLIFAMIIGFMLLYKLWRYFPILVFDPILKNMAKFSIGNSIVGILYNLPRLIFPILMVNLISAESAGYFFIAMNIGSILYAIPQSISNSLLAESTNGEELWKNVGKSIKFNLMLLLPGLLSLMIFGKFILNLFNPNYLNAFTTLIIMAIASIPLSIINIFYAVRNAQKRVGSIIKIFFLIAMMAIIISIPLIKTNGIEGAAISYLIANIIGTIIITYRIKHPADLILRLFKNKDIDLI